MLINTFQHIPGIGSKLEKRLWESGIRSWNDLKLAYSCKFLSKKFQVIKQYLHESECHYAEYNPNYFTERLPSFLHWRLLPEFRNSIAYLDIETDGMSSSGGSITTIAVYDGSHIHYYIRGATLDYFKHEIQRYKVLVTYNGKCFDVPFIENYFGITLPQAQIDLRFVLRHLGFKGGLKQCEVALNIDRGNLEGVSGKDAAWLWRDYQRNGNYKALETLMAYNIEDTVNLETLLFKAYNLYIEVTPFEDSHQLPLPLPPPNPFTADDDTISKLKDSYAYFY